jgi:hypothetical protein
VNFGKNQLKRLLVFLLTCYFPGMISTFPIKGEQAKLDKTEKKYVEE